MFNQVVRCIRHSLLSAISRVPRRRTQSTPFTPTWQT